MEKLSWEPNEHKDWVQFEGRDQKMDVVEQRNELLKILIRKDNIIKSLSSQLNGLERQLKSAVTGKFDALARLDQIEGKALSLSFKEKKMDLDKERLQSHIDSLSEDLNKNAIELMTVRQELASASARFENELKEKCEQLKIANFNVCDLNNSIQMLTIQNENYARKLNEQIEKSDELIKDFENELNAKIHLIELYKGNDDDYKAHIDELTVNGSELRQLLNESVDEFGIIETKFNESKLQNQADSAAKDAIIAELKKELADANYLLKSYLNDDDSNVEICGEFDNIFPFTNNYPLKKGMTITEIYAQYCNVVKELHHKEQDCKIAEIEMKNVIEDVKEKAVHFDQQQSELKRLQATNDNLIKEKSNYLVEKFVGQNELDNCRSLCDFLNAENNELKSKLKFYETTNVESDFPVNATFDTTHPLLDIVYGLLDRIKESADSEDSSSENGLHENCCLNSSRINVCDKSVEVSEDDLMVLEGTSNDNPSVTLEKANFLSKIEELTQDNNKLRSEMLKSIENKNLLSSEANLSNVQLSTHKQKIQTLEDQIQTYLGTIAKYKIANQYLITENKSAMKKLSLTEGRFQHLQEEHRSIADMKKLLEVESLGLKPSQDKAFNEILGNKLGTIEVTSTDGVNYEEFIVTVEPSASSDVSTSRAEPPKNIIKNHESYLSDTVMGDAAQMEQDDYLYTLQLNKRESVPENAVDVFLQTNSISSFHPNTLQNERLKLYIKKEYDRCYKRARMDSSESSSEDGINDVGEDNYNIKLPNIALQYG